MLRCFAVLSLVMFVAGCGDPLRDVPKLEDVALDEASDPAAAVAVPEPADDDRPLFAKLLGRDDAEAAKPVVTEPEANGETGQAADVDVAAVTPAPEKRRGLLGLLRRESAQPEAAVAQADAGLAEPEKIAPEAGAEVVEAAYEPEAKTLEITEENKPRRGLFSRRKAAVLTGPDAQEIAPGTALAFGEIARVCALKRGDLGREVERSGGGKGKFRLYDSIPNSTGMRPFYITGFDDGCPRQVTAALALFATAESHEAMRYGRPFEDKPYSETDKAYEKVKRAVCRSGRGKPCGAQMGKLSKSTAFITVYDRFGGAQNWHNILLHDGSVIAMN